MGCTVPLYYSKLYVRFISVTLLSNTYSVGLEVVVSPTFLGAYLVTREYTTK